MAHLRIKEWDSFQHYKDRNPPWIKLHNELLHSRTWVSLDDASKALAVAIMLLASRTENKIPADPGYIKRVAYLDTMPDLQKLVAVDFIEIIDIDGNASAPQAHASKVIANRTTETETETYKPEKKEKPRKRAPAKTRLAETSLPDDWRDYCQTKRPELDPDETFNNFRDYWIGHGKAMADWRATWQRWVRNENTRPQSRAGTVRETNDERRAREADEHRRRILAS